MIHNAAENLPDAETAMLRADIDVVAVPIEVAADGAVETSDYVAIDARGLELEEPLDGRQQPANDLAADRFAQLRVRKREIVAALDPIIDDSRRLAVNIEQKPGISSLPIF